MKLSWLLQPILQDGLLSVLRIDACPSRVAGRLISPLRICQLLFLLLQRNTRKKQQKELRLCYGLQFEGTVRDGEVTAAAPGGSCSPCVLSQEAERDECC